MYSCIKIKDRINPQFYNGLYLGEDLDVNFPRLLYDDQYDFQLKSR